MKKALSLVVALTMMVTSGISAFASEVIPNEVTSTETVLISGDELSAYAEEFDYEMETEDGYTLQSISVAYERIEDVEVTDDTETITPYAFGDDVKDVTKVSSDIYFPSSALASNWYDGPLSKVEKTYSQTFAGQYSCSASVSVSTINAGISFSISQEVTKSTTLERPAIASNQKVNIKEFAVYDQYSFNLYNIWGNLKGSGYIYKPMGLYITQATYAK